MPPGSPFISRQLDRKLSLSDTNRNLSRSAGFTAKVAAACTAAYSCCLDAEHGGGCPPLKQHPDGWCTKISHLPALPYLLDCGQVRNLLGLGTRTSAVQVSEFEAGVLRLRLSDGLEEAVEKRGTGRKHKLPVPWAQAVHMQLSLMINGNIYEIAKHVMHVCVSMQEGYTCKLVETVAIPLSFQLGPPVSSQFESQFLTQFGSQFWTPVVPVTPVVLVVPVSRD